jgi:hypothetical protein
MGITRLRPRFLSPALILSCLALFVAFGAGSYAAAAHRGGSIRFTNARLKNGWRPFGQGTAPPGYAKDSLGIVHLRGSMTLGTTDQTAFVLPRSMRPKHFLTMPVATFGNTEDSIEITPKGQVFALNGTEASAQTALDGISFAAGE